MWTRTQRPATVRTAPSTIKRTTQPWAAVTSASSLSLAAATDSGPCSRTLIISTLNAESIRIPAFAGVSISFFTSPPAPSAVAALPCCPGSVATPADTPPAQRTHSRSLRTTLRANSGSPRPSDPWPPPAAGKTAPPRSVHPAEVRALESASEPLVPALTAPRATTNALRPCTGRPSSGYCRSCRAPNKDLVPYPESPSRAQRPAHSRPFVHTTQPLRPSPLPTWRNPDPPAPAKPDLPRIGPRGCMLPRALAVHSHTPDDPSPLTAPVQSRARARPGGCTLSPVPPPHTDSPDTKIARAPAVTDRFPSTPAAQAMRTHKHCTARLPRTPALPAHSIA